MDPIVMQAIVDEVRPLIVGQPLDDVVQIDSHRFLLRFAQPPFPRLHVAIHPRLSTLHLTRGQKSPAAPTELASALTRESGGRRVVGIAKPESERLVRIDLEGGRALVLELMGKASNLLLLDERGHVLRFARGHHGEFRRPEEGARYEPPPALGWPGIAALEERRFRDALAAAAPGEPLGARLAAFLPGFSLPLAREIEHRARVGEDPWEALADLRARLTGPRGGAILYAPAPPDSLPESFPLTPRNLFAFVIPLSHAAELASVPAPGASQAEEAATACHIRHMEYAALRGALAAQVRRESRRTTDLAATLETEQRGAEASARDDRRRGELILAGLQAARREGDQVRVTDHYDSSGGEVSIPVEPRLSLQDNAQRYFKAARRADRARTLIPPRLERLRRTRATLEGALAGIEAATGLADLEALERRLQEQGLVQAFRVPQRPDVDRRHTYVPVRRFITSDGFAVLVGRTAAENDHLTFSVAAPHDLWLHAAGWSGAHVVVRNPRRLAELPETAVREAATLAAWFSKGKGQGQLDVHVAWRRHVRKGRGMSPGMVMLRRHRTVRVAPAAPRSAAVTGPDARSGV